MPLWKKLTVILGGAFFVIVLAVVRAVYLFKLLPEPQAEANYAAEVYQYNLKNLETTSLFVCQNIGELFGDFVSIVEHNDKVIVALSTVFIAVFTITLGIATIGLRRSTDKLWQAGEAQIKITKTAADATKVSADASLVALRPWLSCKAEIAGPLSFTPKGDALFKFKFTVKNVGHSPAMNVDFSPRLTLYGHGPKKLSPILILKRMADLRRDLPVDATTILLPGGQSLGDTNPGLVLFPGDSQPYRYRLCIPSSEIEESCEDIKPSKNFWPVVFGLVVCGLKWLTPEE